jgi:ribosomal protein S18 acetylase RimI-like enzyme
MTFRDASPDDVTALQELWCRFMMELHTGRHPSEEEREHWVSRLKIQLSRGQVVVAEEDRHAQGFAGFIEHSDRDFVPLLVAFLVDLYVTPAFRGQEVGKGLLCHVTKRAAGNGCKHVWTNTAESNQAAQRCLRKAGFKVLNGFAVPGLTGQKYFQAG